MEPSDIRSDLTWKWKDNMNKIENFYEVEDDKIIFNRNIKTNKILTNKIQPINDIIEIDGILRVKKLEGKTFEKINFSEILEKQIFSGDLQINGNFNIIGDVNWSGKTNFVDIQVIRAEDNVINLNYKGNHLTSKNGGIILKHGINKDEDCSIIINGDGYWDVNPGMNFIAANIQHLNIERDDDVIIYFNGKKIKLLYEEIE